MRVRGVGRVSQEGGLGSRGEVRVVNGSVRGCRGGGHAWG